MAATTLLGAAIGRGLGGIVVDLTSARATFIIGGCGVLLVTLLTLALCSSVPPTRPTSGGAARRKERADAQGPAREPHHVQHGLLPLKQTPPNAFEPRTTLHVHRAGRRRRVPGA
jgi:hypothetical protein